MKYFIEIVETSSRIVNVKADTSDEAIEKVEKMYRDEEVVLYSGDYKYTDFKVVGREKDGE